MSITPNEQHFLARFRLGLSQEDYARQVLHITFNAYKPVESGTRLVPLSWKEPKLNPADPTELEIFLLLRRRRHWSQRDLAIELQKTFTSNELTLGTIVKKVKATEQGNYHIDLLRSYWGKDAKL